MLSIQNSPFAANAARHSQIYTDHVKTSAEKLSSGYRINKAADDAAGLAVSEKMRRQIRGLKRGTANAQDGISYVQTADGSMNEVHSILQRMNELAVGSLNDTLTESDRAALDAEFDQLRSEIDRISQNTYFNDRPVFEEHEASYYQILGNRKWEDSKLHTILSPDNELSIHLPSGCSPDTYTLTVPDGSYTTQELIDEIDDALCGISPDNPGFTLEYTSDGFCNLNFESADKTPVQISSVDGYLAYLLYDYHGGSASTSLLGTTVFDLTEPLIITGGQNDELGFYIEGKNGVNFISMQIPGGQYTRSQMIDLINANLAGNPGAAGVTAKEYGNSSIQITGGNSISITGLKGNMFKLETAKPIYSSVFYDNVRYGNSNGGTYALITGNARYYSSLTAKFEITDANNTLRFKLNGSTNFTQVTLPNKEYTMSELVDELNRIFQKDGIEAIASPYGSSYLRLSSKVSGSKSHLEFDTTPGSVFANAYEELFLTTKYLPARAGQNAYYTGAASLSGALMLPPGASLTFHVDDKPYTINGLEGNYTNLNSLIQKLNDSVQNDPGFAAIKDKLQFTPSGYNLMISSLSGDIQKIHFEDTDKNDTYRTLFTGVYEECRSGNFSWAYGSIDRPQGSTQVNKTDATATAIIPDDKRTTPITIDSNCNEIQFYIQGTSKTITLPAAVYSNMSAVVSEMNRQFSNSSDAYLKSLKASFDSGTGRLIFTSTPLSTAPDGLWSVDIPWNTHTGVSGNYAWKAILGTEQKTANPSWQEASKASLTTYDPVSANITLNAGNNSLTLDIGNGPVTVNIPAGSYPTRESLRTAIEQAIQSSALNGNVTVTLTNDGKIQISANSSTLAASGSFYKNILISRRTANTPMAYTPSGSYSASDYTDAYIIGRKDLTSEPIEIVANANDVFTFDFTYKSQDSAHPGYAEEITVTIPPGTYDGSTVASILQDQIQKAFDAKNLTDFEIKTSVGGISTGVVGSNDDTALQIAINRKTGCEPAKGDYIIDGIRGNAASSLFYKTTGKPTETHITGTKDLSDGITFLPGQNEFTLSVDSVPYKYTFPTNLWYDADDFADLLNEKFANGDDNGNAAPLEASIENGALKISHKIFGAHTISEIGGSARNSLFFEERMRTFKDPVHLLVGFREKDSIELPYTRINSCALAVNSITIGRPKYAQKALGRIHDALDLLSLKRSTYGSVQNRLEHTIDNNFNMIENIQAGESRIRDADMAREAMELAKSKFLQQASQTILAHANQKMDSILNFL